MTKLVLNRQQILEADDVKFKDVPCPEWAPHGTPPEQVGDVVVRIRNLTAEGRAYFLQQQVELELRRRAFVEAAQEASKVGGDPSAMDALSAPKKIEIEMLLVLKTAVDENMQPLFSETDLAELAKKNSAPVARCASAAQKLSALGNEPAEAAVKS